MVRSLSDADAHRHGEMLLNRVRKNLRKLRRGFAQRRVEAYRVYDWDIPEVRAVVDHYAGRYVLAEFERSQTEGTGYLDVLADALRGGLRLPAGHLATKRRRTQPGRGGGSRYPVAGRSARGSGERFVVREGPLRFLVDIHGHLDTGLFADHRALRARVHDTAEGQRVLNLYAYTGSFSVAALAGGAAEVTSVDLSGTYLAWAEDNLRENGLATSRHLSERGEVRGFLREAARRGLRWDLIVLDPPSHSTVGGPGGLDVMRDHPGMLRECLACLSPGGTLYFSTNHQRFSPRFDGLPVPVEEISDAVAPGEYRRRPHRTFVLQG